MNEGFRAWHEMIRKLRGRPDLTPMDEEQASIECFSEVPAQNVHETSKRLVAVGPGGFVGDDEPSPPPVPENESLPHSELRIAPPVPRSQRQRFVSVAIWIVIASAIILGLFDNFAGDNEGTTVLDASIAHVAFVVMALLQIRDDRHRYSPPKTEGGIVPVVWRQFLSGWTLLWASWLGLYAVLALETLTAPGPVESLAKTATDLFHITSSYAFLYLFLVLDRPSIPIQGFPDRDREFQLGLIATQIVCGVTAVVSIIGHLDLIAGVRSLSVWMTSLLAAISMMYFFMGLGYRELRIRRTMLAPLLLYVAIQMLYPVINGHEDLGAAAIALPAPHMLLWAALGLKMHLFFLVTKWIRNGRLREYMEEVKYPRTSRDLESLSSQDPR